MYLLFLVENPMIWLLIVAVIFLLFGGSRLPQLAKALGQSKRSFQEGLEASEDKTRAEQKRPTELRTENQASLESIDDEALFAEAHRRARIQADKEKV